MQAKDIQSPEVIAATTAYLLLYQFLLLSCVSYEKQKAEMPELGSQVQEIYAALKSAMKTLEISKGAPSDSEEVFPKVVDIQDEMTKGALERVQDCRRSLDDDQTILQPDQWIGSADIKQALKANLAGFQVGTPMPGKSFQLDNILLYGPAGTGKSVLGPMSAQWTNATYYEPSVPKILHRKGDNGQFVKQLFEDARNNSPAIVFLDDADMYLASGADNQDWQTDLTAAFKAACNEVRSTGAQVQVIAATKLPWKITRTKDLARLFGIRLHIDLPDVNMLDSLLRVILERSVTHHCLFSGETRHLAKKAVGRSGDDVVSITNRARNAKLAALETCQWYRLDIVFNRQVYVPASEMDFDAVYIPFDDQQTFPLMYFPVDRFAVIEALEASRPSVDQARAQIYRDFSKNIMDFRKAAELGMSV